MSTSYECPYVLPDVCGAQCCFVPEMDGGDIVGWHKCCGCNGDGTCFEPIPGLHFFSEADLKAAADVVCTECSNIEDTFATARLQTAVKNNHPEAEFGLLRVQKVVQPGSYDSTALTFTSDYKVIVTNGWRVIFQRFRTPGPAIVLPGLTPKSPVIKNEKFLTATVVLPETQGPTQYVVTVLESSIYSDPKYRFALLMTGEWSVLFLRDSLSTTVLEKDCGCKEKNES